MNITQAHLVRALSTKEQTINKQTINKLVNGHTRLSDDWAKRLETVLGLPWQEILDLDSYLDNSRETMHKGLPATDEALFRAIGRRFRNVRIARTMMMDLPEKAAERLNIEVSDLNAYEQGALEIPIRTIINMCGKFKVSPEYLLLNNWERLDEFLKDHIPQEPEE